MATPERHWDKGDHEHRAFGLRVVGEDQAPQEPAQPGIEDDPWAELGIAAVICFLVLALVLPALT
jgi:hypothetical protein